MEEEVILKFKNNCMGINEPITYLNLFYFIRKEYMRIYKEEKEKTYRNNGPYVICGHDWKHLSIEGIYKHGDGFTLVMGS
jgi:hypothetical protein